MDLYKLIDKLNSLGKPAEISFTLRIGENTSKEDIEDNSGGGVGFSVNNYGEDEPVERPEEEIENARKVKNNETSF
jgi:hypothetical protein